MECCTMPKNNSRLSVMEQFDPLCSSINSEDPSSSALPSTHAFDSPVSPIDHSFKATNLPFVTPSKSDVVDKPIVPRRPLSYKPHVELSLPPQQPPRPHHSNSPTKPNWTTFE